MQLIVWIKEKLLNRENPREQMLLGIFLYTTDVHYHVHYTAEFYVSEWNFTELLKIARV